MLNYLFRNRLSCLFHKKTHSLWNGPEEPVLDNGATSELNRAAKILPPASSYLLLAVCRKRCISPSTAVKIIIPMTHFPIVEYEQLTDPKAQSVYDEILTELGFGIVPNLFKSMAANPDLLEANWKKFRSTILQGDIPRTLKEMIGIVISQANDSEYALKVHLHGLSALGISEEVLLLLVSDFANCPLPDREKAIITFGLQAATNPQKTHSNSLPKPAGFRTR